MCLFGLSRSQVEKLIEAEVQPVRRLLATMQEDIARLRIRLDDLEAPGEPEPEPEEPEPEPEPTPPPSLGDATHDVAPLIDESFDPASPTLRTGEPLTAEQRTYHDAFTRAFLRGDQHPYTSVARNLGDRDAYALGRFGQPIQVSALLAFSRTGDGRVLDKLTAGWNAAYDNLVVEWDASKVSPSDGAIATMAGATIENGEWRLAGSPPWAPHRKWLCYGDSTGRGNDLNNLQTVKPWAVLTQYLWTLEANRGKPSPGGLDYGAEADKWQPVIKAFIDAYSKDTTEPYSQNYRGLDGGMLWGGSRRRAAEGTWPILVRGEGHAVYNSLLLTFYLGLLGSAGWDVPNWEQALVAADQLAEYIRDHRMVDSLDSNGEPSIVLRQGGRMTALNATYTGYVALELAHVRDIGRWNSIFDDETLVRVTRSYADMIKADGSTKDNIASSVNRTGREFDVTTGSPCTATEHAFKGLSATMRWDATGHLFSAATAAQERVGGYEDARMHVLPALQFVSLT